MPSRNERDDAPSDAVATPVVDLGEVDAFGDTQRDAPFAEALRVLADIDWQRLHVAPGPCGPD